MEKLIRTGLIIALVMLFIEPAYSQSAESSISYPSGLKIELITEAQILIKETVSKKEGEKLGVLISSFNGKPASASIVIVRLIGYTSSGWVIGGRSVYATGKVKLGDGRELPVTNSAYQYIPQSNYKLEQLVAFKGPYVSDFLADPSSYRAYNYSDDIVKFEIQNPNEFFSIGSFGAYIKPVDVIYGLKGDSLKGIGVTPVQQSKCIVSNENGYKVIMSSSGELVSKNE